VARIDDLLVAALKRLPPKPDDSAKQAAKKRYSEQMSEFLAQALAEELRHRGLREARPAPPGEVGMSGAERRLAGGIGAKKVDVTWTTEESGLMLALSVKSINFRDGRTGNYQKNLTNRRGDMLMEAVSLHRRFPYAVLCGMFFLDYGAAEDDTSTRRDTFTNAHQRLSLFTGRTDPAGREEQFERLYLLLVDANPFNPRLEAYLVGQPDQPVQLADALDEIIELVAERNFDFYEAQDGQLLKITHRQPGRRGVQTLAPALQDEDEVDPDDETTDE